MSESKKPVDQASLRRMMAEMKSSKKRPGPSTLDRKLKKYKISKKEELLIQEAKSNSLSDKSSLPRGFFDAKPAKSILKNSSSYVPPPQPYLAYNPPKPKKEESKDASSESQKDGNNEEDETPNGELPKGFFDDPVKDAKARQVEYKDPADQEWEKFKKEISIEINTASEIAAEDQVEATTDRQLEEIEDQMNAWHRVAKMEKERDKIEDHLKEKTEPMATDSFQSDEEEDADLDEFMNWRNKC